MSDDPAAVLGTALRLACAGWPVFPCVPGEKRPLTTHGMLDATTDPDVIHRWWRRAPTANLAMPTGERTVDVLDVDIRPTGSGFAAFNELKRAGLLAGYSRVVATPSGGMHVYFRGSTQQSSRLPDAHIDFKAQGGYVLVPPSAVGKSRYVVIRRTAGPLAPLDWAAVRRAIAPADAATPSRPRDHRGGSLELLAAWVSTLPEGRRNAGTFWAACRASEQGYDDLSMLVEAGVRSGLPEREVRRTIVSAQRRVTPVPGRP